MDDNQPVDDDEFVYRRIHPDFYDPTLAVPIQPRAFRPSKSDTTGLSVVRVLFAAPHDLLPRDPANISRYFVARIAVRDLRSLGLAVVPDPVAGGPSGHAVIPELSWENYQAKKLHWKPILLALAKLASADIVHRPDQDRGNE